MPDKTGRLTPQERMFAATIAATGDKAYSSQKAGYKSQAGGSMALARPAIQQEIRRVQVERLFSEALPAAVECVISIVRDAKAPSGARVQAAKVIFDRTIGADAGGEAKEPHEMTPDELDRAIQRLKREAAERSRPVLEHQADEPEAGVFD